VWSSVKGLDPNNISMMMEQLIEVPVIYVPICYKTDETFCVETKGVYSKRHLTFHEITEDNLKNDYTPKEIPQMVCVLDNTMEVVCCMVMSGAEEIKFETTKL
jgi:hypothetical protein